MLVRRTTRGRSQRSEIARRGDGRSVSLMSEITLSLEKTRRYLFFYRASSDLIFIWFPLDSPPSGLI